jgi:acetylornithine/succinyldiaminopimelate/putrescine aminotransferase
MGRHQKIITRDPKVHAYIESSTNHDYVTLVKAISGGFALSPMIIINATSH